MQIADDRIRAVRADRVRHESHDAERGKADDPEDDLRHDNGKVTHGVLCRCICLLQGNTGKDTPREDADVVRVRNGVERVVNDVEDQVVNDLDDAARRRDRRLCHDEVERRGEGKRECHGDDGREERRDDVEAHDGLER